MRKSKIVEIEGVGEVTVKEVSPFAVYSAMSAENKVKELLALAEDCISLSGKKLQKLYASEIEQLTDAFLEVNSSFLAIAEKLGIKPVLANILSEVSKNLPPLFADSYKQVMGKLPGTTDGAAL